MNSSIDGPHSYRVEVSGWTVKGLFFVEKAMLRWTDAGEKSVELLSRLHESSLVFVRLIHIASGKANFPIAYRVLGTALKDSEGRGCVRLSQLRPKVSTGPDGIGGASSASKSGEAQKQLAN
ncbi:MAG TPA: hypothetical protein VN881_13785 [Candidatus Acidoferrales bacterium]|jgi:hypothetical protein|nr:hypothetical protein [Candidatus Acidoferrales bacterium]